MRPVGIQQRELEGVSAYAKPQAVGRRRRVSLRISLSYVAALAAGAAIGASGGELLALPLMIGLVAAGGGLLVHGSRPQAREGIDELGRRELIRARRVERPVTVASIALERDRLRGDVRSVAFDVARAMRETDLVGYAGGSRLLVVFTETSAPEALEAWTRLRSGIDPVLLDRLRVGFSSFPEDNPTWQGLKALAFEREREEALAGDTSAVRTLPRAAVASEA